MSAADPLKDLLLAVKMPTGFDSEAAISAYMRMSPEEQRHFLSINDLSGQRRANDAIADAAGLLTSSVSKNDIKDFLALHGVGSFERQVSVGTKQTMAELVPVLLMLGIFFGIPLFLLFLFMFVH